MRGPSQIVWPRNAVRRALGVVLAVVALGSPAVGLAQRGSSEERRDEWQRPIEVLDALGAQPGSRIADIGAGGGYFTFKLASRVGPGGKVYAVDINQRLLDGIRQRADRDGLDQIQPILGAPDDPHLPHGLDAILVVKAYHEFRQYDDMLAAMFQALRPGGRLVIIDGEASEGRERDAYSSLHRVPESIVRTEAERRGFQLAERREDFFDPNESRPLFFLVFERPRI